MSGGYTYDTTTVLFPLITVDEIPTLFFHGVRLGYWPDHLICGVIEELKSPAEMRMVDNGYYRVLAALVVDLCGKRAKTAVVNNSLLLIYF